MEKIQVLQKRSLIYGVFPTVIWAFDAARHIMVIMDGYNKEIIGQE